MANQIQIKRTSTHNATDVSSLTLAYGELAWSMVITNFTLVN